jgi:hypothetical protein
MVRDERSTVTAEDAFYTIASVLHDDSTPHEMMVEMVKKASDYYHAEFSGKRQKVEFCIFVGSLIHILCSNLESALDTAGKSDDRAN